MKIAHFVCRFPPYKGGIGNVCYYQAKYLSKLGNEVVVFTHYNRKEQGQINRTKENFKVKALPYLFAYGNACLCLPVQIKQWNQFDVIHLHFPFIGFAEQLLFLKKIGLIKPYFVVQYHMDLVGQGIIKHIFSFYNKFTLPLLLSADKIITSSLDYLIHHLPHSFLFFFPLSLGIYSLFSYKKELFIPLVIVLSFFATTVYISGPKFDAVTGDELRAAKYVWSYFKENSQDKEKNYCVIGNTWPLLALEGVSGEYIIAGGFPVYQEYAQPERVSLFENLNRSPHINDFKKALKITQANSCFFMTEDRWITQGRKQKVIESLNKIAGQPTIIGDVYIWYYQPNSINL